MNEEYIPKPIGINLIDFSIEDIDNIFQEISDEGYSISNREKKSKGQIVVYIGCFKPDLHPKYAELIEYGRSGKCFLDFSKIEDMLVEAIDRIKDSGLNVLIEIKVVDKNEIYRGGDEFAESILSDDPLEVDTIKFYNDIPENPIKNEFGVNYIQLTIQRREFEKPLKPLSNRVFNKIKSFLDFKKNEGKHIDIPETPLEKIKMDDFVENIKSESEDFRFYCDRDGVKNAVFMFMDDLADELETTLYKFIDGWVEKGDRKDETTNYAIIQRKSDNKFFKFWIHDAGFIGPSTLTLSDELVEVSKKEKVKTTWV